MEPRISLITLGVADVAESAAFYRALDLPKLDFESDDVAFLPLEGTWLGLYRRDLLAEEAHANPAAAGPGAVTLAHTVESETRVDEVLDEAAAAGAEIVQEGIDRDWGGYSGYFADPDGHRWEVAWNPDFEIERALPESGRDTGDGTLAITSQRTAIVSVTWKPRQQASARR